MRHTKTEQTRQKKTRQVNQQSTLKMQHFKIYDAIIATLRHTQQMKSPRWGLQSGKWSRKELHK